MLMIISGPDYASLPTTRLDINGSSGTPRETLLYNRRIVDIVENEAGFPGIVLDAPIFNHVDQRIYDDESPAIRPFIYKYDRAGIQANIGLEDLSVEIDPAVSDPDDPNATPADHAVAMMGIEDGWVNNVVTKGFRVSGVLTTSANRITIANTQALDPAGSMTAGGDRYHFHAYRGSNDILWFNCLAKEARHAYVSNGAASTSGLVALESAQIGQTLASEGHRQWVTGMLFDGLVSSFPSPGVLHKIGFFNRPSGTHGWSSAHSVVWNAAVANGSVILIQKPPTAQNYAFGGKGTVTGHNSDPKETRNDVLEAGVIEATGEDMQLGESDSLYREQLRVRQQYGAPPDAPALLTAKQVSGNIELEWIDVAQNETGYSVERSLNGNGFSEIAQLPANSTSFTDEAVSASQLVVYRVRAMDSDTDNHSAYSNPSAALTVAVSE